MCDFIFRHEKYGQSSCPVIGQVPTALARSRTAEGQLEQPWPWHLSGARDRLRLCGDISLHWGSGSGMGRGTRLTHGPGWQKRATGSGWAQPGGVCARAGLQAAGDCLCCGIAGAGADSPLGLSWGPGPWGDAGQEELLLPTEPWQSHHPRAVWFSLYLVTNVLQGLEAVTTDLDFCLTCEPICAGRAGYRVSLSHNHPFLVFQAHMEII